MKRVIGGIAAALVMSACGSDPHEDMRDESVAIDGLAHEIARDTAAYCDAAPWAAATCAAATAAHESGVMTRLEELASRAERMDGYLREVGAGHVADVGCVQQGMADEVQRFTSQACAAGAGADGAQHCAALMDGAAQLHARANEVLAANRHWIRMGASGRMPGVLQPVPTGEHDWPWAAEEQPGVRPMCSE